MPDTGLFIAVENVMDLIACGPDTGQMRCGFQRCLFHQPRNGCMRALAGCPARAIGHRNKGRPQFLKFRDIGEQLFRGLIRFGWKKLKAKGDGVPGENIKNMHE